MAEISKDAVLSRLRQVKGPDMANDIVSLGLVSDILVKDGRVMFSITVPADRARELEPLRQAAEKLVGEMPGVVGVMAVLTAERKAGAPTPPRPQAPAAPARRGAPAAQAGKAGIPGVEAIIAVASGKGGVGK